MSQAAETRKAKPAMLKDSAFVWEDPLDLEGELSEEERMVRDTARGFAQDYLMPRVVEAYAQEKFDAQMLPEMGKLGLLGPTIPEEYGGAGLGYVSYGLIARELERVDLGYRSTMSVQSSLVMYPIYAYGSEAQRRQYLPKLASGEIIGCFGLTEPDHGSDPGSMVTRAEKVAGGYKLNGAKTWISNAPVAQVAVVWAKLDNVIRGFIVERGTKGFSDAEDRRQAVIACFRHRRDRAGRLYHPRRQPAAECEGAGRTLWLSQQRALRHRLGRHGGGRILLACGAPIHARPQAVQPAACRQSAHPEKARRHADRDCARVTGALRLGRMLEAGKAAPPSISLMKRNNCGKALDVARLARDMHGGNGISQEYHVMRVLSNLETVNTYEGTHDIHALILGRAQTGIQAFF